MIAPANSSATLDPVVTFEVDPTAQPADATDLLADLLIELWFARHDEAQAQQQGDEGGRGE